MHISQLDTALKYKLKPIYLISGNVPLLVQETRDKIREAAKQANFLHHDILTVEPKFDWLAVRQRLQMRSLFSDKSIIDLRLSKWEDRASKILLDYLSAPTDDLLIIISSPKLTSAQQKTTCCKAIATAGEMISIRPISIRELPQWIQQRLRKAKIQADTESIHHLAEWTEGNLLATQQVIDKLPLIYPNQKITLSDMLAILTDNAQFTVFDLSNAALLGDTKRVTHILSHLKFAAIEPTLILWALAREIRHVIQLLAQKECGTPVHQLLQKEWQSRKTIVGAALQRQNTQTLLRCLQKTSRIDEMIKGVNTGNYWNALESLALSVAGS